MTEVRKDTVARSGKPQPASFSRFQWALSVEPEWAGAGTGGSPPCSRRSGWVANHKRVERIWRREGLKVPARQPRSGRLWLNDGSLCEVAAPG